VIHLKQIELLEITCSLYREKKRIIARPMTVPSSVFENWSQADPEKATMGAKGGRKLNIYTVFQKSRYTAY
jgi:hypothetical protein